MAILEAKRVTALTALQKASITSATHEAGHEFQRPGCHEGTRLAVFDRLLDWLLGDFEPNATFLWLYGDAGAGKSSIGQTFAIQCAQKRRLLASFFFWRNEPQRASHTSLVATLVHQAATTAPALRNLVADAMIRDPCILDKHLKNQIMLLLIEPINELMAMPYFDQSFIPTLILIDGLDECSTVDGRCSILKAFAEVLPHCHHRLKIIIASRPEPEIKVVFNINPLIRFSTRIALNDTFQADEDIEKFLHDTFSDIKSTHNFRDYIPELWPAVTVVPALVRRSSGQFIFASTVGKYLSDPDQKPTEQLEIIMAIRSAPEDINMPYVELNTLYSHVLSCVPPHKIGKALEILSCVITVLPALGALVGVFELVVDRFTRLTYQQRPSKYLHSLLSLVPGDLEFYLSNLSSLLGVQDNKVGGDIYNVVIRHASLGDYLLDHRRSHKFYCEPQRIFTTLLEALLEHLNIDGLWDISTTYLNFL